MDAPLAPGAEQADAEALRRLLGHLPGIVYRCALDDQWTMEFVSAGCRALTGFEPSELHRNRAVSFAELIHPDDREAVRVAVDKAISSHRSFSVTYRIERKDGRVRWVSDRGAAVRSDEGHVEAIEGFIADITEQKGLEDDVRHADRMFATLAEQTLTGVVLLRGTEIEYSNPRFAELFGTTVDALRVSPSFLDLVDEVDRDRVEAQLGAVDSEHVRLGRFEFRGVTLSGGLIELQTQINGVDIDGHPAIVGVVLDVTERRKSERRYHQAQKMESLGQMAAGVAHDFNNVLTVLRTTAELHALSPNAGADCAEDVQDLLDAVDRGAALSRQLMRFARVESPELVVLSIPHSLENLMPMLRRVTGREIELHLSYHDGVPPVKLDPADIEQVVLNLVINARDAISGGGEISLDVGEAPAAPAHLPAHVRAKPMVTLTVKDTGVGIEPDVASRVFEPFFTTKGDRGTGLGLGNVWRIATEAGGCVTVDSELGRGSEFTVYFPVQLSASESAGAP